MAKWLDWFRVGEVVPVPVPEDVVKEFEAARERNYRAGQDWSEAMRCLMDEHRKNRIRP